MEGSDMTKLLPCFFLAQIVLPSLLILRTPKRSGLRYVWILCSSWLAYRFFLASKGLLVSHGLFGKAGFHIFLAPLQALNLLLINPLDEDDFTQARLFTASSPLLAKLWHVAELFVALRGIGTPWRIKNIPSQPGHLLAQARPKIPRSAYLLRQAVIFAWQYLVLDALRLVSSVHSFRTESSSAHVEHWYTFAAAQLQSISTSLFAWLFVARVLIDASYRATSLLAVGLGRAAPEGWPPVFGSMWTAYTLRNFWGKFWHQSLRWPFTSVSSYLTRRVLRLPRPSLAERYLNIGLVFTLSGLLHVLMDSLQGVPPSQSGAMIFFPLFTLGFIIEDSIQAAWKRFHVTDETCRPRLLLPWQRVLGFIWVVTWISLTSPYYLAPSQRLPREDLRIVPFSIVGKKGIPAVLTGIIGGGAVIIAVFGGEI
ncbi:hypothetical protein ED733_002362 [Metarhizium rileyi]|uniref:Wax synthase domain-containing protein n=1 Tax=Metarhizium rileyi (strain RCEF 4871) TaxID=1649241 RepID=A0A5C6GHJ7_METRR|nr:hypothetical protein ED733_002362 [Metarhizium rileyi]